MTEYHVFKPRCNRYHSTIDFTLQYISSKENIAADALSRGRLQEYFDHMSDTYNLTPAQLTEVPVDQETRSSISSAMIRRKL